MTKVFISYSSLDEKWARRVAKALDDADIEYFLDQKDIAWGDDISDRISQGLGECSALIVIVSPASLKSQWVQFEIGQAKGLGLRILPFLTHPSLDVPSYLQGYHYKTRISDVKAFLKSLESSPQVSRHRSTPPSVVAEDAIRSSDPNDVRFCEVEVRFSDTLDQFIPWLEEKLPQAEIDNVSEDPYRKSDFYCSGKPGALIWSILVSGQKSGIPFTQRYDLVHDWLHPIVQRLAPTDACIPWDTGLFPEKDGEDNEIYVNKSKVKLRDCRYWVLFAAK